MEILKEKLSNQIKAMIDSMKINLRGKCSVCKKRKPKHLDINIISVKNTYEIYLCCGHTKCCVRSIIYSDKK